MKRIIKFLGLLLLMLIIGIAFETKAGPPPPPEHDRCQDNCYPEPETCGFVSGGVIYCCGGMKKITYIE